MKTLCFLLLFFFSAPSSLAQAVIPVSVSYFSSLRAEEVNLRLGPGLHHPIDWVYHRKNFPVKITAEFKHWRKIHAHDGTIGWIHQGLLSHRRTFIITGTTNRLLYRKPMKKVLAHLEPGVIGHVLNCEKDWCRVRVADYKGWLRTSDFWGDKTGE